MKRPDDDLGGRIYLWLAILLCFLSGAGFVLMLFVLYQLANEMR
jgi:hypothetical protein